MSICNVDSLVGRSFVAKSGKVCKLERIGPGALRIRWQCNRADVAQEDYREAEEWVAMLLESLSGAAPVMTVSDARTEAEDYARWKKGVQ